jgi:putative glutamine amidotransferase
MKPRPLILITPSTASRGAEFADTSCSLSDRYPRAIIASGGTPWILPCLPDEAVVIDAVSRCDGVLLTGGDDVQAGLYATGLSRRLKQTVSAPDPARDLLELLVIREVFRQRRPLLAICRGEQMLNVALGGTLIVDLPSQVKSDINHNRTDRKDKVVHKVALTPDSILTKIAGKRTLGVNSTHHQAVGRVAPTLRATAVSADGVVEALELKQREAGRLPFLLAVQFHPERLFDKHREFRDLFGAFIGACGCQRNQKQHV